MRRMILPIFKKYKKLLISIMIVSAMGCGIMTGLSAAYVSLDTSLYHYLDEYCYPEAFITTEVTNRDMIDKLQASDSVKEVNARLCGDTYLKSSRGRYLSVRIFSYNADDGQKFHFWERKDSNGKDSVYLEYNFAHDNHINAGDTVKINTDQGYREYFVSGIVTCPETISVQPTDDSWGVNTDFGYAYASVDLLTAEYQKRHDEAKEQLDEKKGELDTEWGKAEKELNDAEAKLNDAKQQLDDNKKLFSDSTIEAEEKLEQLMQAELELEATKSDILSKRDQLAEAKKTIEQTIDKLVDNESALMQASDGIKQIDEALKLLDNISSLIENPKTAMFMNLLSNYPNVKIESIVNAVQIFKDFSSLISAYGFEYKMSDKVADFADKLINYMDHVVSDYMYITSGKFDDLSAISESDKNMLITVMKRYHVYSRLISLEENYENTKYVLSYMVRTIEDNNLYNVVLYIPVISSGGKLEDVVSDVSDMLGFIDTLSEYTGKSVSTAGDLVTLYSQAGGEIKTKRTELTEQRIKIISTLAGYGLTEEDISDVPSFINSKLKEANDGLEQISSGLKQIDEGLPKIDEGLQKIADGREQILSGIEDAEKKLTDAEKQISENEEKFIDERTKALTEFSNLKEELEKAYSKLEEGEGYDKLCNQFLIYFKDGTDTGAELEKLKDIFGAENIKVKSSYNYENSAVKKRIDDNLKAIETMSILMPAIFFGIILIVVFLFMSLIIKQSRREIGILRALGFSKTSIKLLFCGVNLVVSLFSIVLGTFMGYCLMKYVGTYYSAFFPLPKFTFRFNMWMFGLSAILTIIVGQISTLISTGTISRIMPSEAMSRPAPEAVSIPKFVQKLTANASPVTKFSVAILFRNKMRFVFSVICIASSVMMIFSSLAFITSKNYLLHQLYDERIKYDCQIFFDKAPDDELIKELSRQKFVKDVQKLLYYQADIEFGGKSEKGVINAIDKDTELVGVYDRKNKKLNIPESGIILEKHLAQAIGANKGDIVRIKGHDVKVEAISDQSVSRFQYMSYKAAEQLGDVTIGSLICNIDRTEEQKLLEFLTGKAAEKFSSVGKTAVEGQNVDENTDDKESSGANYLYTVFTRLAFEGNEKIFKTYDLAAGIIIGFAIIIGLVIVINIAQTNLLEKKRELCVMRTLGFQHNEISKKWFVQSFLQFIFSCIIGLPIGIVIANYGLQQLSTSSREYVFANSIAEYIFTILLVLLYVIVSHIIAMNSMKKWDLVENVKDKE